MSNPSSTPHTVTALVELTPEGDHDRTVVHFTCTASPTDPCHVYPACACESWDLDYLDVENERRSELKLAHRHPSTPHDECWMSPWFESDGASYEGDDAVESVFGPQVPTISGSAPVEVTWTGEEVVWKWAA